MLKWFARFSIIALFGLGAAQAQMLGQFYCSGTSCIPGQSKRIVLNTDFNGADFDYAFINMFQEGADVISPYGSSYSTGTVWNSNILDANGYPCSNVVNTSCPNAGNNPNQGSNGFGGGLDIPSSINYSGPYCFHGYGSETIQFNAGSPGNSPTFSTASGQTCATFDGGLVNCDGSSHFTNSGTVAFTASGVGEVVTTDEHWLGWCIAFTYSGTRAQINWEVTLDDPNNTGHYAKGLEFYQRGDGSDLAAGKIFRAAYKSPIVALDPSAIRTMNNLGGNSPVDMSFLNRMQPGQSLGYNNPQAAGNLLPYGVSSGTNAITLAGVTGTPASMTHGEVAQFRAGSNTSSSSHPAISAIAIPVSGTVEVTTSTTNTFSTGDVIQIIVNNGLSQNVLNLYQATITVIDSSDFEFTLPNTGLVTTCASTGTCNALAIEDVTLDVGSRGAYPVQGLNGGEPWARFWNITAGDYYTFCFNKTLVSYSDGQGNFSSGAWVACSGASAAAGNRGWPIEIFVAFVNELNAMKPKYPIDLWMMIPTMGITCNSFYCDPDATAQNEWPANAVNVAMNGANGYAGLQVPGQLIIQPAGNEIWNSSWAQTAQLAYRGYWKWQVSTSDDDSFSELLSLNQAYDIKNSAYMSTRVNFIDGGFIQGGYTSGSYNYERVTGAGLSSTGDPANPIGSVAPITYYNYGLAVAPYVQMGSTSLATYIGTATSPGSLITTWISDVQAGGYSGTAAQADLVAGIGYITGDGNGNSTAVLETTIANIASLTSAGTINNGGKAYGRPVVGYEGYVCGGETAGCSWDQPGGLTALSCTSGVASATIAQTFGHPATFANGQSIVINNVSVAGYNSIFTIASVSGNNVTWDMTCPGSSPSATNWQGYYGSADDVVSAFNTQMYFSSAWGTTFAAFNQALTGNPFIMMPAIYVEFGSVWGFAYFDTYGATNTEGSGLAPVWNSLGTYDAQQVNFLLNRDLPGRPANDDRPVGLDMTG